MVHTFPADQQCDDGMRRAHCGFAAHYSHLEPMLGIAGMPCELCMRAATTSCSAYFEPPKHTPEIELRWDHDGVYLDSDAYAVGLHGERQVHQVPSKPLWRPFEGRLVVVANCGRLGWLLSGAPPAEWDRCVECPPVEGDDSDA